MLNQLQFVDSPDITNNRCLLFLQFSNLDLQNALHALSLRFHNKYRTICPELTIHLPHILLSPIFFYKNNRFKTGGKNFVDRNFNDIEITLNKIINEHYNDIKLFLSTISFFKLECYDSKHIRHEVQDENNYKVALLANDMRLENFKKSLISELGIERISLMNPRHMPFTYLKPEHINSPPFNGDTRVNLELRALSIEDVTQIIRKIVLNDEFEIVLKYNSLYV